MRRDATGTAGSLRGVCSSVLVSGGLSLRSVCIIAVREGGRVLHLLSACCTY